MPLLGVNSDAVLRPFSPTVRSPAEDRRRSALLAAHPLRPHSPTIRSPAEVRLRSARLFAANSMRPQSRTIRSPVEVRPMNSLGGKNSTTTTTPRPTDSHQAFLNIIPRPSTATPRTVYIPTPQVPCDTPLKYKPHQERISYRSLTNPHHRLGSLNNHIFEDCIAGPPLPAHPEDVKLEMLVHLANSEYTYMCQVIDWILPLAEQLDMYQSIKQKGVLPLEQAGFLLRLHEAHCDFFQDILLTDPCERLAEYRKERDREKVISTQTKIQKIVMKADGHIICVLDLLTTFTERLEIAKREEGFWLDFPPTLQQISAPIPQCAKDIAGFVAAKGYGVCWGEKDEEYWVSRKKVWGMIMKFHLGDDLVEQTNSKGNFSNWVKAMVSAVEEKLPARDIIAWRKQEKVHWHNAIVIPFIQRQHPWFI